MSGFVATILRTQGANVALALWLLVGSGIAVFAGEPVQAFRRVLVPAESPETWPRDGKSLLPVEAEEFESWVRDANAPSATANLVEAEYQARLDEGELVDTRGWWKVELSGKRVARLPLDELRLPIRDAKWRAGKAAAARLGWWPAKDGDSLTRALEVPASGVLDFQWSVAARPATDKNSEFAIEFPAATRTRLVLELPAGKRPQLERSLLVEAPKSMDEGGRWVLALPARKRQLLRIEDSSGGQPTAKTTIARQQTRYVIQRGGVDLEAELKLTTTESLPKSIEIALPAGLQFVTAKCGDHELPWRVVAAGPDRASRVAVELPEGARGPTAAIKMQAWGPLVVDEVQRLPQLALDDLFWASGEIELAVDESLELRQLETSDCIQTDVETASGDVRKMRFAAFDSAAAVEIAVHHRPLTGHVRSGVSLELGSSAIAGRVASQINIERGQVHQLTAALRPGWIVDSVETLPADALSEWYVDENETSRALRLQLNRAIAPDESVQIVTTLRSPVTAIERIRVSELSALEWRHLQSGPTLLQLRPAEQYDLEVSGDWRDISAGELAAEERELLQPQDGARVAKVTEDSSATIRLAAKKVAYDATVQVAASLLGDRCALAYQLVCNPRGGGIDHALVYFAEPLAEPLQWIESGSQHPLNATRMPQSDPRFGGLPVGGELWRLELGRLYARPITISARQSIPWREQRRAPLVSLPDAASQQGRVTVANRGAETPTIVARNMASAPLPLASHAFGRANGNAEIRAVFRFQPTRLYDSAPAPELWIGPTTTGAARQLIATRVDLQSRYTADGSGVHRATYELDAQGATTFDLKLSEGIALQAVRIDGVLAPVEATDGPAIPLPPGKRSVGVVLDFASRGEPLTNGCKLVSPLPTGACSLLAGQWTVKLPHEFVATEPAADTREAVSDWTARLFGPLARQQGRPFNPIDVGDWNSLWAQASGLLTSPAQAATDGTSKSDFSTMPDGMATHQFSFVNTPIPFIIVSHWRTMSAMALAVFLLCAVGSQLVRWRMSTKVWLALASAAASLLLPVVWAPLATAATLGFVMGAIWQWIQPGVRPMSTALAFLVAGLAIPTLAIAAPVPPTIERVLVPVDKDGKPVGTKYFVATDFLSQLIAPPADVSSADGWLLTDMRCDGQLVPGAGKIGVISGTWNLVLEIDVMARDVTVNLPLVQSEASWPTAASIDGIPAAIVWNDGGKGCSIRVSEPGPHQLLIPFEPDLTETNSKRIFSLTLPPVVGAKLRVLGPTGRGEVWLDGTPLAQREEAQQSIWQGTVSSGGRLNVDWQRDRAFDGDDATRHVDQLMRLRVAQTGLELDVELDQKQSPEWPDTIIVAVEAGWQWAQNNSLASEDRLEELPDGRQVLVVHVPPAARDREQLSWQFVATEISPLGRIRPPAIEILSIPVERRWLAVTCDRQFDCVASGQVDELADAPAELTTGPDRGDSSLPSVVVDLDHVDEDWHLAVRPGKARSTLRDRLSIAAGKTQFRVNYRVEVIPQKTERFGWSIAVPEDLSVESFALTEGDQSIPIEWVRADSRRVNVFFKRSAERAFRLELHGTLPMPADGLLPLPRIASVGQLDGNQVVALYREEDVLAEWRFPQELPWVESGASLTAPFDVETRFVRAFTIDAATAEDVQIAVSRSDPVLTGATLTSVERDSDSSWEAAWECDLHVEQGTIDGLRIQVPSNWSGPYEVTPTARVQVTALSTAGETATISVRLPQPARVGDDLRFVVRSPLVVNDGQPPSAPRIQLLADGERAEYLSLPASFDGEPLSWTRSGIEPDELPAPLGKLTLGELTRGEPATRESRNATQAGAVYRIASDAISVTLRPQAPRADLASVRLAETTVFAGADGSQVNVTRYLISPAGLDHCELKLPERETLVRASVDGHPALVRSLDLHRFQLQLSHPLLPQTVDVVTQSSARRGQASERLEISQPVLEQSGRAIPIDLSLWTLHGRFTGQQLRPSGGASVSPAELATTRLEWLTSISQRASRTVLEVPAVDGYSWFVRWSSGLRAAAQLADRAEAVTVDESPAIRVAQPAGSSADDSGAQSAAWIDQMAEFFSATELALEEEEAGIDAGVDFGQLVNDEQGEIACFVSDGGRGPLVVELTPVDWTAAQRRFFALGSLGLVALVSVWLTRTPRALAIVTDWPAAWGVLLGVIAWAWLRPSLVGLAIAAVSLVFLIQRIRRERKSPRHDSSKLPNSIPEEVA